LTNNISTAQEPEAGCETCDGLSLVSIV